MLAALRSGVRVIFTEHGRFHPDRHSWKRRLLNPALARATDEIVAISDATRDALVHHEWLPRRRIRLIYNGVTPPVRKARACPSVRERLGIDGAALVLGTISRLDPIKNQAMMLDALAAVRRRHPDCVLILAGDGPERDALERRVVELELDGAVFFTGFVSDIAAHLDAIDVFLLTSWSEGTSMTLLEAMSFGKPVVATRVGGNVEILEEGRSALLIDAGDVPALSAAVERLADDAGRCASASGGVPGRAMPNASSRGQWSRPTRRCTRAPPARHPTRTAERGVRTERPTTAPPRGMTPSLRAPWSGNVILTLWQSACRSLQRWLVAIV